VETGRIEREREFHNSLSENEFAGRRLIDKLSWSFYSKEERSPIWGPVWSQIDLRGKRVLDYGCGNGGFSSLLAKKGALVEGIDISESLVELATRSASAGTVKATFSVRDAHATEFPADYFDHVFGNGILHHLELERAYKEVARVLKHGGTAFFMEPMEHHPLAILMRKATPAARSVDEKPLSLEQIEMAQRFFDSFRHTDHYLTAVIAAPLHLANRTAAFWAVKGLDHLDRGMIQVFPSLGRYAWQSMLELGKS
jgi:2-polyprenyl-3-methyl-5-hydroxy-6-metoxy-1,4-benzoquinol methylase